MVKSEWVSQQMEGGASKPRSEQQQQQYEMGGTGRTQATTGQLTDGSRISAKPRMQVVGSSSAEERGVGAAGEATVGESASRDVVVVVWDRTPGLGWYGLLLGKK